MQHWAMGLIYTKSSNISIHKKYDAIPTMVPCPRLVDHARPELGGRAGSFFLPDPFTSPSCRGREEVDDDSVWGGRIALSEGGGLRG